MLKIEVKNGLGIYGYCSFDWIAEFGDEMKAEGTNCAFLFIHNHVNWQRIQVLQIKFFMGFFHKNLLIANLSKILIEVFTEYITHSILRNVVDEQNQLLL